MKLSITERLILSNQYQILEKLYPADAPQFAIAREIVESGYTGDYPEISHQIHEELSVEECREVLQILGMFSHMKHCFGMLKQKPDIEEWKIDFPGFDGNNETKQMAYTRFVVFKQNHFIDLIPDARDKFNAHMPTLDRYRRMLREWNASGDKHQLAADDILRIANA